MISYTSISDIISYTASYYRINMLLPSFPILLHLSFDAKSGYSNSFYKKFYILKISYKIVRRCVIFINLQFYPNL